MYSRGILHVPVLAGLLPIVVLVSLTGRALADGASFAALAPEGEGEGFASATYNPDTGEFGIIAGPTELSSIEISSAHGIFTGGACLNVDGPYDECSESYLFKALMAPFPWRYTGSFGSFSFGNIAELGLTEEYVQDDLTVRGTLEGAIILPGMSPDFIFQDVDLVYISEPSTPLQAGDADMDFDFDQFDLVEVQQAAKYLTGQPATWGEGDWNGAPGGSPDEPPVGDGVFDNIDIVAALQTGSYMQGSYLALSPGYLGDAYASAMGNRLPTIGTLAGGDDAVVDLVYVPEPSTFLLSAIAMIGLIVATRRKT